MRQILGWTRLASLVISGSLGGAMDVNAQARSLYLAYPPRQHQTSAEQIFLIGTAPTPGEVLVNGEVIERSPAGHFAPSFPLQPGENRFTLRYSNQEIQVQVTRTSPVPELPAGVGFAPESLTPERDISRLSGELFCFGAVAPANATVSVQLGGQTIPLFPQSPTVQLPPNSAVLTGDNQPLAISAQEYLGCTTASQAGNLGKPQFQVTLGGETTLQTGPASVEILSPSQLEAVEVSADAGVARTGPGTNYSRLTPLPKGTRATVTGREGDWLRLDYGGWIEQTQTRPLPATVPPRTLIRSITSRQREGATEMIFPLQTPVPISVEHRENSLTLTLYNAVAQTDTIRLDDDPLIERLDWQQVNPTTIEYRFALKTDQQWGYDLRYEGTSLILSLRHPPQLEQFDKSTERPLTGVVILLDPGHGGAELGAKGPNGYPEKAVNLQVSKLLQAELVRRGATVYMTRDSDREVSLAERVEMINRIQPAIALSIHYNALPDNGDAINTAGIGTFWYHPQAHDLAVFLHNYLVDELNRPSYGVFWNNLALTRPHTAPSVLLELGFMINPVEFEWITDPQAQQALANTLAEGITTWFFQNREG